MLLRLENIYQYLLKIIAVISGLTLVVITLLICWDVLMRAIFNLGQGWVTEVSENFLVFMVFLGSAYVLKESGHVSVDIIYINLNQKKRRLLDFTNNLIILVTSIIMAWRSIVFSIDNFERGILQIKTIAWPMGVIFSVISFGFVLLAIECIRRLILFFVKPNINKESERKVSELL